MADGGGYSWQDKLKPELRCHVVKQMEAKIAESCRALHKCPPENLRDQVGSFENIVFETSKYMKDYMRMLSHWIIMGEKMVELQAAEHRQQHMHMGHQMQLANTVQGIQGGNNSQFTTPQAVPRMGSTSWPPFQSPNQHMHGKFNQGPANLMPMSYQNFVPTRVAPVAPSVQSTQQITQSIAIQTENHSTAIQMQPTNIARCHPTTTVQMQGQQIARPNGHQNHLLEQQHFGVTQQQVDMRLQMLGANVAKMNTGERNNQQNDGWASGIQTASKACEQVVLKRQTNMYSEPVPPAQSHIADNQQSNQNCPSLQNPRFVLRQPVKQFVLESTSQSPIVKPGVVAAVSSCVSMKSALTSTVKNSGFEAPTSPSPSVKSSSPSAIADSGIVPVALSSDKDSSLLLHNNAAVNGCNQATPTELLTSAPPPGHDEDQKNGGAETPVVKKPLDRLLDALRSSSPAVLCSSVNLMESALIAMDLVPLRIGSNNKMKRVYAATPSESPTLDTMDGSTVILEFDPSDSTSRYCRVKRKKTQNAIDALLDEIDAVNNRLIDTLVSIPSKERADGRITSCNVTLIKLSYTAVSLAPDLKSHFAISENIHPLIMPQTLLIPADYPRSSPVILNDEGEAELRTTFSWISVAVDKAFRLALSNLQEPRTLTEMAGAWDSCVRRVITDYAYRLGGGTLDLKLRPLEDMVGG